MRSKVLASPNGLYFCTVGCVQCTAPGCSFYASIASSICDDTWCKVMPPLGPWNALLKMLFGKEHCKPMGHPVIPWMPWSSCSTLPTADSSSKISKKKNTNSSQMCKVTLFGCATSTELWASKYITRCHILHVASLKTPEFPLVPAQYAAGQVAYSRIRWWSTNRRILVEWLGDEIQQVFGITVVTWNVMKKRVMFMVFLRYCIWCCFVYIWGGGLRQRRTCSKGHNTQLRLVTGVCSNWLAPTLMLSWIIPA